MDMGIPELLIILVIIVVLFGPGRLGKTMGELGQGIKAFKDGLGDSATFAQKKDEASK